MDVASMISRLGLRMEDTAKKSFPDSYKLAALESAQEKLAVKLHNNFLTELQVLKDSATVTTGVCDLATALSYDILKGEQGILNVRMHSGLFCTKQEVKDLKTLENLYTGGSLQNPLYYVFQNKIYVLPTSVALIDIFYLRMPAPLMYKLTANQADSGASTTKFDGLAGEGLSAVNDAYNGAVIYSLQHSSYHVVTDYVGADLEFTVSPAAVGNFTEGEEFYFRSGDFDQINLAGAECQLNPAFHELVITYAEGELWKKDGKLDRSEAAIKTAELEVLNLNAQYVKETGIGAR